MFKSNELKVLFALHEEVNKNSNTAFSFTEDTFKTFQKEFESLNDKKIIKYDLNNLSGYITPRGIKHINKCHNPHVSFNSLIKSLNNSGKHKLLSMLLERLHKDNFYFKAVFNKLPEEVTSSIQDGIDENIKDRLKKLSEQ